MAINRKIVLGLASVFGAASLFVVPGMAQAAPDESAGIALEPNQISALAAESCGSQAVTNADDGYFFLAEDANLQKAPYAACGTYARGKKGQKIWTWCTVENDYDNTWIWGRIDGTETYGWIFLDHALGQVEKPTKNDGWCPNERPANLGELDGPNPIVEERPTPDEDDLLPVQEFEEAEDVDPTLPPIPGKQDGTLPPDDFINEEGEGDPTDAGVAAAAAAAKLKYGAPIKRAKVIARAKDWLKRNVQYSQSRSAWDVNKGKKYRTDCSGFVSMSWASKSQPSTRTINTISKRINWSSLKPGDALLRTGHVQLFEKWANKSKTQFWIIEQGSTASDMNHYKVKVSAAKRAYHPIRYNKIRD